MLWTIDMRALATKWPARNMFHGKGDYCILAPEHTKQVPEQHAQNHVNHETAADGVLQRMRLGEEFSREHDDRTHILVAEGTHMRCVFTDKDNCMVG